MAYVPQKWKNKGVVGAIGDISINRFVHNITITKAIGDNENR